VIFVEDEMYLALPKGGLAPEHVLIIPVAHTQRYRYRSNASRIGSACLLQLTVPLPLLFCIACWTATCQLTQPKNLNGSKLHCELTTNLWGAK
jgi:hypothetical protein